MPVPKRNAKPTGRDSFLYRAGLTNFHISHITTENGVLNLDDATIDNAKVIVKDGGLMNVSNDGEIHLGDSKALRVDMGGTIHISSGKIF